MNVLIVGGSSGIGKTLMEKLLASGHKVWVVSREASSRLDQVAGLTIADLDATDEHADWSFLPDSLDGLVYAAGSINLKPFTRLKIADYRNDFAVNVEGAVNTIQVALSRMRQAPKASIVLFSSVAAQRGLTFHASIAAAKGAVEGLTKALSAELAPQIRVNAIALSLTDTPLAEKLLNSDSKKQAGNDRHPLKRVGTPNDGAALAQFLLSEDGSWITGQVIGLDGGMSAIQNI